MLSGCASYMQAAQATYLQLQPVARQHDLHGFNDETKRETKVLLLQRTMELFML